MKIEKNIVAIGGGGFGRTVKDLRIEEYILSLSKKEKPNICFIPTATGDNDSYKVNYYDVFTKFNCNPTHIDFFKRTINLEKHIDEQDIIFVGGGNTKSMLAVWREWRLDEILHKAYIKGTIMSGVVLELFVGLRKELLIHGKIIKPFFPVLVLLKEYVVRTMMKSLRGYLL